jgi:hypothetical protein
VVAKTSLQLAGNTIYEVDPVTWKMVLVNGPAHNIVESIPDSAPMVSANNLHEEEKANKQELERLRKRIGELNSRMEQIQFEKMAALCEL